MKHEPAKLRKAILTFREDYRDRYGLANPSTPSGLGQVLGLVSPARAPRRRNAALMRIQIYPCKPIKALSRTAVPLGSSVYTRSPMPYPRICPCSAPGSSHTHAQKQPSISHGRVQA